MADAKQSKTRGLRTCIACGANDTKVALCRIVRRADGTAGFDPTGRESGRGAYVCGVECLAKARKSDKLSRALKCRLEESNYERIALEINASKGARPSE